jgi:hypothetical protein
MFTPEVQSWLAAALVLLTLGALLLRTKRKSSAGGCGSGCGCGKKK